MNFSSTSRRLFTLLLLGFLSGSIGGSIGCSSSNWLKFPGTQTVEEQTKPIDRIVSIWQAGDGRDTNNLPSRGFAGQLFFFEQNNETPVKIEGDVRVYVFDDQGTAEEQAKPIHQYDFKNNSFNNYVKQTNLGTAYQIFVPYSRKGKHQAKCSLQVRLTPMQNEKTGERKNAKPLAPAPSPIFSEMVHVNLPGTVTKKPAANFAQRPVREREPRQPTNMKMRDSQVRTVAAISEESAGGRRTLHAVPTQKPNDNTAETPGTHQPVSHEHPLGFLHADAQGYDLSTQSTPRSQKRFKLHATSPQSEARFQLNNGYQAQLQQHEYQHQQQQSPVLPISEPLARREPLLRQQLEQNPGLLQTPQPNVEERFQHKATQPVEVPTNNRAGNPERTGSPFEFGNASWSSLP